MTGRIFDVREFTVHDGPGCRMTFFLKGCPLSCRWCHNPEGQHYEKELMVKTVRCTHCGACRRDTESDAFRLYGRDPAACPNGVLSVAGEDLTPEDVLRRVLPLRDMLRMTEGGVTFSGGEPLFQDTFLKETLDLLHENGIHTAIETSGYASEEVFSEIVLKRCDYVIMDLKLMDDAAHRHYTGVSNVSILKNAQKLKKSGKDFIFRTPLIPGVTDTEENLAAVKAFVEDTRWETLPYNTLAGAKYPMLGREFPMDTNE